MRKTKVMDYRCSTCLVTDYYVYDDDSHQCDYCKHIDKEFSLTFENAKEHNDAYWNSPRG